MVALFLLLVVASYFTVDEGRTIQIPANVTITLKLSINSHNTNWLGFRDNSPDGDQISIPTKQIKSRTLIDHSEDSSPGKLYCFSTLVCVSN